MLAAPPFGAFPSSLLSLIVLERLTKWYRTQFSSTSSVPKGLAADANGQIYVVTAKDVQIIASGKKLKSIAINYNPTSLAFSQANAQVAIGGEDGKIRVLDGSLNEVTTYDKNRSSITSLAYSPDGSLLAAGESSGKIVVYDAKSGDVRYVPAHSLYLVCAGSHAKIEQLKLNQWVFHTYVDKNPIYLIFKYSACMQCTRFVHSVLGRRELRKPIF